MNLEWPFSLKLPLAQDFPAGGYWPFLDLQYYVLIDAPIIIASQRLKDCHSKQPLHRSVMLCFAGSSIAFHQLKKLSLFRQRYDFQSRQAYESKNATCSLNSFHRDGPCASTTTRAQQLVMSPTARSDGDRSRISPSCRWQSRARPAVARILRKSMQAPSSTVRKPSIHLGHT
jgi:hypothetical protein